MTVFIALLRGVNLGKRQLKMADLKAIGERLGLEGCRTYVASGNLLFRSSQQADRLKSMLGSALTEHMGAPVPVVLRTAQEMAGWQQPTRFPAEPGNRVAVFFSDTDVPANAAADAKNLASERIVAAMRELYVHYPDGIGASKLSIPAAREATARNMNTVAKLAELAREIA